MLMQMCVSGLYFHECTNAKKKKNVNEASTEINELFGIYVIFTSEEQH